jgi:DAD family
LGIASSNFHQQIHNSNSITTNPAINIAAMAPKKNAREPAPTAAPATQPAPAPAAAIPVSILKPSTTGSASWDKVVVNLYNHYIDQTPQRTKLLDVFLVFLVAVGALQFFYCLLVGNFVRFQFHLGGRRRIPPAFLSL